jgi:ABC-type polysaccharide/polyol phosphate transport system ATPase subunit
MNTVISVSNVSKKYRIYDRPRDRLKEVFHPLRRKFHRDYWAIKDVSFDVQKAEVLGIIGQNGSGKSTLLQVICGILRPTSGGISVKGRISALLELGAGFNPDFTGRANVYTNGILAGFTKEDMDEKIDQIADFAGIAEYIDQPVRFYSSGMFVRLAFAAALNVRPEILIIDEAMSVGDVFFQQKCFKALREIVSSGTTCIFVSHDLNTVMNICDRALLLNEGRPDFIGSPSDAVMRYLYEISPLRKTPENRGTIAAPFSGIPAAASGVFAKNILTDFDGRQREGSLQITALGVTDENNVDTLSVRVMESLRFHICLRTLKAVQNPIVGIHLFDRIGNLVFAASTRLLGCKLPPLSEGDELLVSFELTFTIAAGQYTFNAAAAEPTSDAFQLSCFHDFCESLGPINVMVDKDRELPFSGMALMPMKVLAP